MARAIENIGRYKSDIVVTETFRKFAGALSKVDGRGHLLKLIGLPGIGRLILKLVKQDFIKVMVQNTITPTVIKGGVKVNVIPDRCELAIDCRILPGMDREKLAQIVLDLVGSDKIRFDYEIFSAASESPIDTELFSIIERVIASNHPDSAVSPFIMPGGTDSRFLRAKGIPAYGLIPLCLTMEDVASVHGNNEKVSIENLAFGLRMMYHVIAGMCL
jgi:acetylornithine deacetylase/succinyl-diaminopimelate desuccinylase-like protein